MTRRPRSLLIVCTALAGALAVLHGAAAADSSVSAARLDAIVPALMTQHKVPGVAVVAIADRQIAWERYYGVRAAGQPAPVDAATRFEAASMTKPLAAHVALKLAEEGRLDLDRPLRAYLEKPYLSGEPQHLQITARMVLNHTTGFPNWRAGGWLKGGPLAVTSEPGTKFSYSGEAFTYLQHALEKITGEPFEQTVMRRLFLPLGMSHSSLTWTDRVAKTAAAGHNAEGKVPPSRELFHRANSAYSLYCAPRDYARFLIELMKTDRSAPHSLSAGTLARMLTRATRIDGTPPPARQGGPPPGPAYFGLGWAIEESADGDRIRHGGSNGTGFRCYCEWYPTRGTGLVIMTNATGGAALWREVIAQIGER